MRDYYYYVFFGVDGIGGNRDDERDYYYYCGFLLLRMGIG